MQNDDEFSDYWDIAAGGTNTDRLNFFTRDVNVVSFRADGYGPDLITTSAGTARLTQAGVWTNNSSQATKTDFMPVDARAVAARVATLSLQEWRYKEEPPSVRHIGPTSEDFYAAFGLGDSAESIGTVDADGVALAAIQGLFQMVIEQQEKIEALENRLAAV